MRRGHPRVAREWASSRPQSGARPRRCLHALRMGSGLRRRRRADRTPTAFSLRDGGPARCSDDSVATWTRRCSERCSTNARRGRLIRRVRRVGLISALASGATALAVVLYSFHDWERRHLLPQGARRCTALVRTVDVRRPSVDVLARVGRDARRPAVDGSSRAVVPRPPSRARSSAARRELRDLRRDVGGSGRRRTGYLVVAACPVPKLARCRDGVNRADAPVLLDATPARRDVGRARRRWRHRQRLPEVSNGYLIIGMESDGRARRDARGRSSTQDPSRGNDAAQWPGLVCPSAQPAWTARQVRRTSSTARGRSRWCCTSRSRVPATPEVLALSTPRKPARGGHRLTATCAEGGVAPSPGATPPRDSRRADSCRRSSSRLSAVHASRKECRWFSQEGGAACLRCAAGHDRGPIPDDRREDDAPRVRPAGEARRSPSVTLRAVGNVCAECTPRAD